MRPSKNAYNCSRAEHGFDLRRSGVPDTLLRGVDLPILAQAGN